VSPTCFGLVPWEWDIGMKVNPDSAKAEPYLWIN